MSGIGIQSLNMSEPAKSKPRTLGRYEACTNCHRRKIRCDGGHPCTPCSKAPREYAHPIVRHRKGEVVRPRVCTYDDLTATSTSTSLSHSTQIVSNNLSLSAESVDKSNTLGGSDTREEDAQMDVDDDDRLAYMQERISILQGSLESMQNYTPNNRPDSLSDRYGDTQIRWQQPTDNVHQSRHPSIMNSPVSSPDDTTTTVSDVSWSSELPRRDLVLSFIETMSKRCHLISLMLNIPRFITQFSLPLNNPHFPTLAIIHACCAMGQILCPMERLQYMLLSERKYWEGYDSPYEYHFRKAKAAILGFKLDIPPFCHGQKQLQDRRSVQLAQAAIVATFFAYASGHWVETWMMPATALRICVLLGLNGIDRVPKEKSIGLDDDDLYQRMFTFWLAFTLERCSSLISGWSSSLSSNDISSPLPFLRSNKVPWQVATPAIFPNSKHFPITNPPELVSPALLVFKTMWLVSKVTTFLNHVPSWDDDDAVDNAKVRTHPDFIRLDRNLREFRQHFPEQWQDLTLGRIESINEQSLHARKNLVIAHILLHGGILQLHAPFFSMDPNDFSMSRSLESAHAITSMFWLHKGDNFLEKYVLPNSFVAFVWSLVGRTLIRDMEVRRLAGEDVFSRRMEARFLVELFLSTSEVYPKFAAIAIPLNRLLKDPSMCIPTGWHSGTKVVQTPNQLHSDLKKPLPKNPEELL